MHPKMIFDFGCIILYFLKLELFSDAHACGRSRIPKELHFSLYMFLYLSHVDDVGNHNTYYNYNDPFNNYTDENKGIQPEGAIERVSSHNCSINSKAK